MSTINLNDRFEVDLTDEGLAAYQKYWHEQGLSKEAVSSMYGMEKLKKDHKLEESLWQLMQAFGSNIYSGGSQMFKNNNLTPVKP